MNKTPNQLLVIFGASGDLTERKLIPALFSLFKGGHLPEKFGVLGVSRSKGSDSSFREQVVLDNNHIPDTIGNHGLRKEFADRIFYQGLEASYDSDYSRLRERIDTMDREIGSQGNHIFYLSTPPALYETIARNLHACELTSDNGGWKRLVVEKPFGYDLDSARELNTSLQKYFRESQIYRIDHYLGK